MLYKTSNAVKLINMVVKIHGGIAATRTAMRCSVSELKRWRTGASEPPRPFFRSMVDIIIEHQANEIKDQRAALRSLRSITERESRFRSLTALVSDWYWEQDKEFRFTLVEGSSANVFGYDTSRALGKRRWELKYEGMTAKLWRLHKADLLAHRTFHDLELKTLNAEGGTVWVSISGEPILNLDGRFLGYRGIGQDITRRKLAKEQDGAAPILRTLAQSQ